MTFSVHQVDEIFYQKRTLKLMIEMSKISNSKMVHKRKKKKKNIINKQ